MSREIILTVDIEVSLEKVYVQSRLFDSSCELNQLTTKSIVCQYRTNQPRAAERKELIYLVTGLPRRLITSSSQ